MTNPCRIGNKPVCVTGMFWIYLWPLRAYYDNDSCVIKFVPYQGSQTGMSLATDTGIRMSLGEIPSVESCTGGQQNYMQVSIFMD